IPSCVVNSRLMSASIGKGRFFNSSLSRRQARCTNSLSMLTPRICASRALNSLSSLPNAAISVGHTNVKSLGQKNTTCHLPWKLSWVKGWNALFRSLETTPVRENWGNFCPMLNMLETPERLGLIDDSGGFFPANEQHVAASHPIVPID